MQPVITRQTPGPVPVTAAVQPRKDSVELLLDGMAGPQPERARTTPQSDGQSAAAYHVQHGVRPARTSPDLEPKVVVDRPTLGSTMKVERAVVQQAIDADPRRRDTTAVLPARPAVPRVVVALVSALAVVIGIFALARVWTLRSQRMAEHTAAAATIRSAVASALPAAGGALCRRRCDHGPVCRADGQRGRGSDGHRAGRHDSFSAPPPAPAPAALASEPRPAALTPATTSAPTSPAPAVVPSSKPKPRLPGATAPAATADLGEFRTTFH